MTVLQTGRPFSAAPSVQDSGPSETPTPSFAPTNASSVQYDLVLFTTEDGSSMKKLRKMRLFRDMSVLYHNHFNFRAILFTTTPQLEQLFSGTSVLVVNDFKYAPIASASSRTNRFGMPIITSLFARAQQSLQADYYGYLNSDILLEPSVFEVLAFCRNQSLRGDLSPRVELVGCCDD